MSQEQSPRPHPRAADWELGDRTEAGMVLRELHEQLEWILRDAEVHIEADAVRPSHAIASSGLIAGLNHFGAIGALFYEGMPHNHAIVALVRAAVECFGRVCRVLEPENVDERDQLAEELREHEIARSRTKGLGLIDADGQDLSEFAARAKMGRSLDRYAETAIAVLMAGGASREIAVGEYSFLSGVSHGESLSNDTLTTVDALGPRFELPRSTAATVIRDLLGASRSAMLRHVQLIAPVHEELVVERFDLAVNRIHDVLAVPRAGVQLQSERTDTSAQPSGI